VHFSDISVHMLHQALKELLLVLCLFLSTEYFSVYELQSIAMVMLQHGCELLCDINEQLVIRCH